MTRRAKGKFHGWYACAAAVKAAAMIPPVVRDFFLYARNTSASVAGTAIIGFMLMQCRLFAHVSDSMRLVRS